ncbi:Zn(2)-C6 fungal-type domain-containing protein [Fusarium keratoplasticum]|uniref:Zn(2)-C6 fungal-type domain-containing protein n=1 Tax=Fusarium keratoplasticum TaxID=1328300 RepID=A0ACC0QS50_9HYPO|nr:Zn(2)-C6 fungal-type domain-containing protein [Fusarium keratoplasticum]KAI8663681.1 Zn(2)-C6 fungal-type domain-containing protein [Fusarium keratoplasticum]
MAQTTFRIMAPATFPLSPAAAPRRARLRAPIACQYCRGRKVRCDLNKRGSRCTNCELDDVHCKVANTRRRRSTVAPSTISSSVNTTTVDVPNLQERTVSPGYIVHSPTDDNLASETVTLLTSINGDSEARAPPQPRADSTQEDNGMSPDMMEDGPPDTPNLGSLARAPGLDPMPWKLPAFIKPINQDTSRSALNYLAAEGALWLPEGKLRQALVDACFEFVTPYMPSLDRSELLGHIDLSVDQAPEQPCQKTIGILLFQAILFAGSAFVDSDVLQCLGFPSQREARRSFYRRARLLYDFDVDTSSVEVLHALLLMSFWYEDPDDCKAAAYWIGAHVHHAQQFGVQEKALALHPGQGFYKRLWWSAYIRDALVSMGLRLQPRMRSLIPMLTPDDFPLRKAKGDFLTRSALDRATLSIRMAELCVCINQTMSEDESPHQPLPKNRTEMLDLRLDAWHRAYCSDSATPCSRELEYDVSRGITVGRLLMIMTYYTISLRPENMTPRTDSESPNVEDQERLLGQRPAQQQVTSSCAWPHYSGDQAPAEDSGDYAVHMPSFTDDISDHSEDSMLLDFQKEPLFHQMSNFLELESGFFTQLATSMDNASREEDSMSFIHDLELVG